jgi:HD-like signal output (HDOD) protein
MALPLPTIASRIMTTTGFTFPKTMTKLGQLATDATAPITVMRGLIESDPVLAAVVLAQAAQAEPTHPPGSVADAVKVLGMSTIQGTARSLTPIKEEQRTFIAECWTLGRATGLMLRVVARAVQPHLVDTRLGTYDDATLHTIGLLHDIGTPLVVVRFPQEYAAAAKRVAAGEGPFGKILREELGADTPDVGYLLARNWALPADVALGIRYHSRPLAAEERHQELLCALHVARLLARSCGYVAGADRFIEQIDDRALARLNLRLDHYQPILRTFLDAWEELEAFEIAA